MHTGEYWGVLEDQLLKVSVFGHCTALDLY